MKHLKRLIVFVFFLSSVQVFSQKESTEIEISDLPEYVIITSQNTKTFGGINISIDARKSRYEKALIDLNSLLQWKKRLGIRNQTDLLNEMSRLGFDYVDAYNGRQVQYAGDKTDGDDLFNELFEGGTGSFRVNMIFRKKENLR